MTRLAVLAWAVRRFDVFVFGFGTSILWLRELRLLRALGKRVVFVFHGSDARPPYIDGVRVAADRQPPVVERLAMTRRSKAAIRRIERHADAVIAQPAFSHFFERPVIDFFVIGVPWRGDDGRDSPLPRAPGPIRILHSPSDPTVKGSARIRDVVRDLEAAGLAIELVELRGVPNDVVLREIGSSDFVIDQLYSDAPMVGFATEAAASGRPAIVGGYAWPENHRILRVARFPPVEECVPETLAVAIRRLAEDRSYREALGTAARLFVTETWSRQHVAGRLLDVIEGTAPTDWYFDPRQLRYVEGCGLGRAEARASIRAIVEAGGAAALCVADKPELEQAFLAFAAGSADS